MTVRGQRPRRADAASASRDSQASTSTSPPGLVLGGLCAVFMAVPLAVLGSATGPYDDPKAWALPILVALTLALWAIERRQARPWTSPPIGRAAQLPVVAVAAYGAWWVVTTLASLAPGQSLVGNFGRGLGLLTFGSAILLLPLVWSECRTLGAVLALIDAALLGSAPVCLLAVGQVVGWDPLPKAWDPAVSALTVRSTFGQHIFLGSYLVALVPLAVGRFAWGLSARSVAWPRREEAASLWAWRLAGPSWIAGAVGLVALASNWDLAWWVLPLWGVIGAAGWRLAARCSNAPSFLSVWGVAALLAIQLLVVIVSQARGAFLGMVAGLTFIAFALVVRRHAWRAAASVAAAVLLLALVLVLLNLRGTPAAITRTLPMLGRLGHLANLSPGTPGWVRLQVWHGILDGWRRQLGGEELILGLSPRVRSVVGYGLETQLVTLDRLALPWLGSLPAGGDTWQARYLVDRAHNVVLDHLVTGGLVGVGLWALVVGSVLSNGIVRARAATAPGEFAVRVGALGTVVAHLVEGQVGISTPMPLAVFWVAAGVCTLPSMCEPRERSPASPPRRRWWITGIAAMAAVAVIVTWIETRWLLASVAYAKGVRAGLAGRTAEAYQSFDHSRRLVPWVGLPAEATAYTLLRLAAAETDASRRLAVLREADAALDEVRRHPARSATSWTLSAQVALARARAGEWSRLEVSLEAFDHASRLRPRDGQLLVQWAWALLDARDPARARATAERALAELRGREAWLAWAIVARAARDLGDTAAAEQAVVRARDLAPPATSRILESLGLPP